MYHNMAHGDRLTLFNVFLLQNPNVHWGELSWQLIVGSYQVGGMRSEVWGWKPVGTANIHPHTSDHQPHTSDLSPHASTLRTHTSALRPDKGHPTTKVPSTYHHPTTILPI